MLLGSRLSADHVKSLVATYRPAFQMLFTSRRLFRTTPYLGYLFQIGEKIPEHQKFQRRNVKMCALEDWECSGIEGPCFLISISTNNANALNLISLMDRPGVSEICSIVENDDATHITLFGSSSPACFLKEAGEFIRENFPDFRLPYSLDTEIFYRPKRKRFQI